MYRVSRAPEYHTRHVGENIGTDVGERKGNKGDQAFAEEVCLFHVTDETIDSFDSSLRTSADGFLTFGLDFVHDSGGEKV